MSEVFGKYKNGNYYVTILSDGTKIRENNLDCFIPDFAESMDVTITKYCDGNCGFCYAGCSVEGKHGDIFSYKFLDTLHPYTELALNGNDLSHPDLDKFLEFLRDRKVIANMTVSQKHFMKNIDKLLEWSKSGLIHGLGVSFNTQDSKFLEYAKLFPNLVIHVISGIISLDDLRFLGNNGIKLLILGYKKVGRGSLYYSQNQLVIELGISFLKCELPELVSLFDIISFDNLAIDQLDVKNTFNISDGDVRYMGDEGEFTFYIDLVSGRFAMSSLESEENTFPIMDNVDDMFHYVRCLRQK